MKKIFTVFLALCMILGAFMFNGCVENNNFTRSDAAKIIVEKTGFEGGENLTVDVKEEDENSKYIFACVARNIFGEPTLQYKFRPNDKVTKYDMAKISVYTYAALLCVEDENLEPGKQDEISDIGDLSVEQRWFVHCAINYGFVDVEGDVFNPKSAVSQSEFSKTIDNVLKKAGVKGTGLQTYKQTKLVNFKTFPSANNKVAETVDKFVVSGLSKAGERLAAVSLQGLVNRDEVRLYLDYGGYSWMTDYAISKDYFNGYSIPVAENNILSLLNKYSQYLNKAIVFDSDNPWSINMCVNIAAVEDRIIISSDMVYDLMAINSDIDIKYFKDYGIDDLYEAEQWCYNNLFEYMRRDVIGWMYYERQTDWARDYIIQMKIPTMWVAGTASDQYNGDAMIFASKVLQRYPANIPMLGFGYANDPSIGGNAGIGEYDGVKFHGEYGKYTAVFDSVGNLSFHTAIQVDSEKLKFTPAQKPYIEYDPQKKYVAVTMMESGDAPCYIQYGLKSRQWDDEYRGKIPYNISYGLNNYDLYPLLTQYWFETADTYDYFFGAISGLGYNYPLIGFGDKGVVNEEGMYMDKEMIMKDHYTKANYLSKKLGFDCLGVYSFSSGTWNEYHYEEFDKYVLQYMPDITTVMADMHRGVYQLSKEQLMHTSDYGQRIYHCSTKWSTANFTKQEDANDYLYEEILRTTSNGGQFFQCMAYSWSYGPDDIKVVMDRFSDEYVFVTIDQLDDIYQQFIQNK